ncbi:MAG: hypothetical protein OEY85_00660 [Rhodospirillales bacterium]|nr:hypothetical protein [Rhodospirillales bacterium]
MSGFFCSGLNHMVMKNNNKNGAGKNEKGKTSVGGQVAGIAPEGAGRRKLITGGMAAAPFVAATLSSRSALGAASCTHSGVLSGNLSRDQIECGAFTPGMWQNLPQRQQEWDRAGFGTGDKFNFHFPAPDKPEFDCSNCTGFTFVLDVGNGDDPSLLDALPPDGGTSKFLIRPNSSPSLSAHIVAALLNAGWFAWQNAQPGITHYYFGYSVDQIKEIILSYLILNTEAANSDLLNFLTVLNERFHPDLGWTS